MDGLRFEIVERINTFEPAGETYHAAQRRERFSIYGDLSGIKPSFIFEVDTGHSNGNEIHEIYSNGIVYVYNKNTRLLVTCMAPRYEQMRKYFFNEAHNSLVKDIFRASNKNHSLGLNEVQGGKYEGDFKYVK